MFLLATPTSTSSTISGGWIREDTCPRFCDGSSWQLQHCTSQLTEVRDRQTITSAERRHTSRQRHAQVRPWTVTDSICRLALARCGRLGTVQAWCNSPLMSPQQSAAVSGRLLRSSLRRRQSSATTFCTSLPADRTTPSKSTLGRRAFSVAEPTCLQTNLETPTALSPHSDCHWRHFSSASISMPSELEVYTIMRHINPRFTYLLRINLQCQS